MACSFGINVVLPNAYQRLRLATARTSAHDPLKVLIVTDGAEDEAQCHGGRIDVADGLVAATANDIQQQVQEERAWTSMQVRVKLRSYPNQIMVW